MNEIVITTKINQFIKKLDGMKYLSYKPFSKETVNNLSDKGIYFIFYQKTIIYIGCAYYRKMSKRCSQYLLLNDTGNTLLKKLIKLENTKIEKLKEKFIFDENLFEKIKNLNDQQMLDFIKTLKIKNISLPDIEKEEILLYEAISICCYKPLLNMIR